MSTLNAPKTISRRSDRREDRVMTAYARAVDYADKNRQVVYLAAGALLVVLLAIVGYALLQNRNAAEAQVLLGDALPLYEQGEYRAALDGSGDAPGLLEIAGEYGGTKAGNLARFYAADALYRLGEHEEALRWFEAFDVDDNIVGASALAGQAAIHEDREAYDRAGDLYRRAALIFDHELTTPEYLMDAGRAYEAAGAYAAAVEAYEQVQDDFADSPAARNVEVLLARARARMQ